MGQGIHVCNYIDNIIGLVNLEDCCRERFGLIRVDFDNANRTRTKKASATYYAKVIATRCILDTEDCVE